MSQIILGIIASAALPFLIQVGFTETCANEIWGVGLPFLSSLPGLLYAWRARVKMGGVNWYGARIK